MQISKNKNILIGENIQKNKINFLKKSSIVVKNIFVCSKTVKILVVGVLILITSSCSTKKNKLFNRKYHTITAKYNGYFNGNESLKQGVKKLEKQHKDDFSKVLPVFKTGNLSQNQVTHAYMNKAIKKGSIVIQRHSMSIKGKEYNKWIDDNYLMIAKAYFYKGEFDEAIKTCNYIKKEYKKNEIKYNASLWLARCYSEKKDYASAELELERLQIDRKFPKKLESHLGVNFADLYLKQQNYILALDELNMAIKLIRRKKEKTRYYFILAQLNQKYKNYKKANSYYEKVIKSNPEYEMVFNSKINKAQCIEGEENYVKIREELLKMTRDDKNKEYLDQIYHAIGNMALSQEDTNSAIENFKASVQKNEFNDGQKSRTYLKLGEIYYAKRKYKIASGFYDSTIIFIDTREEQYNKIKEKQTLLYDLVKFHNTISLEDSLQSLAKLNTNELKKKINEIILAEQQKELKAQRLENEKTYQGFENNRYGDRNSNFGQTTSGGKWYFYNPATLSFGLSEFIKKWGKRKNEDDWRRSDKQLIIEFQGDSTEALKSENPKENQLKNKKDPEYYLNQIPLKEEQLQRSNSQIIQALYKLHLIYKDYLYDNQKTIEMLVSITERFPEDTAHTPLAYYNLYLISNKNNNTQETNKYKTALLKKFPNIKYSKIIKDPNYIRNIEKEQQREKNQYELVYEVYKNKNYLELVELCDSNLAQLKNKDIKIKYEFLKALATSKMSDTLHFRKQLNKIIKQYPGTDIKEKAEEILAYLEDPSEIIKTNKKIKTGSDYIFNTKDPHYFILITSKINSDVNYLKTLLSDYHQSINNIESLQISATLFGTEKHLIMIKTFNGSKEAEEYFSAFKNAIKVNRELLKTESKKLVISSKNFSQFIKNKDLKGYYEFFNKNYFQEPQKDIE